jgi:hypothetical protein
MAASNRRKKSWSEMSDRERATMLVLGSIQMSLAAAAWVDLARRDASEVNGSKGKWAAIIAINWVGPIAYFARGRVKPAAVTAQ